MSRQASHGPGRSRPFFLKGNTKMQTYYWESENDHGSFQAKTDKEALYQLTLKTKRPWVLYAERNDGSFRIIREWPH